MRGKLVIEFSEPVAAMHANNVADVAEAIAQKAVSGYTSPEAAMGAEIAIAELVRQKLPPASRVARVELVLALPGAFTTTQSRRRPSYSGRIERGRVLVVDDDPMARATLVGVLQDEFEVVIATGPTSARAELDGPGKHFDVVLADYEMPDGNGLQFLREAVASRAHLIGILVTAHGEYTEVARARTDDAIFRILLKPYDPEVLLACVRSALSLARMRRTTAKLAAVR